MRLWGYSTTHALVYAPLNRETHAIVQPAVASFEQDTDPGNIEEEDPENNVQPDEWYWAGY